MVLGGLYFSTHMEQCNFLPFPIPSRAVDSAMELSNEDFNDWPRTRTCLPNSDCETEINFHHGARRLGRTHVPPGLTWTCFGPIVDTVQAASFPLQESLSAEVPLLARQPVWSEKNLEMSQPRKFPLRRLTLPQRRSAR